MPLDSQKLKTLIAKADPVEAGVRYRSRGVCGNEGIFRICHLLCSEGIDREDATPYLRKWFDYWKDRLFEDEVWSQLYFEDVEVQADEIWPKIKYGAQNQRDTALKFATERLARGEEIPMLDGYGGEKAQLLSIVCYELSRMADPFWLSERDAAEILGLDRECGRDKAKTVLKVLARRFRIIEMVKAGGKYRATRYKFTGYPPQRSQRMPETPEDP